MRPRQRLNKLLSFLSKPFYLCIVFIISSMTSLSAQAEILNTDTFFSAIFGQFESEGTLISSNKNSDHQHSAEPFKAAKIEDLEVRTETNDFDFSKQEITVRVSPTSKAIRKAQEELYKAYTLEPNDQTRTALEYKVIEDAYAYWINEYITHEKQKLYKEWDLVLIDKKSIFEKQLLENDFDLTDYFKVNTEMKDLTLKKINNAEKSNLFQSPFQSSSVSFVFNDIISVDDIKSFANSYDPAQTSSSLKEEEYSYNKYLLQKELDLEIAESKQIMRFGQLSIGGLNRDPFRENFSIGAAFRMPWDNGNRLKIYELRHKLENVDFAASSELEEIFVSASRAKYDLLNLISKHEEMESLRQAQFEDSQKFIEVIANNQGFNPLHALDVKEQSIKSSIENLDSLRDIYESYLNMLKDSQIMFLAPYTNYLL